MGHTKAKLRKDGRPSESRSDGLRAAMEATLASPEGKARYELRKQTIEPAISAHGAHESLPPDGAYQPAGTATRTGHRASSKR